MLYDLTESCISLIFREPRSRGTGLRKVLLNRKEISFRGWGFDIVTELSQLILVHEMGEGDFPTCIPPIASMTTLLSSEVRDLPDPGAVSNHGDRLIAVVTWSRKMIISLLKQILNFPTPST